MASFMRQLSKAEESFHDDERNLEQTVMAQVLDALLLPAQKKLLKACQSEALEQYFTSLRADILKNTEAFLPREAGQSARMSPTLPCRRREIRCTAMTSMSSWTTASSAALPS